MTGFQFQAALTTTTIGFLLSTLLFGVLRLQEGRGGETDSHLTIESGKIDGGRRLGWARNL